MSQLQYRYPGVRPFDREQSDRFRGRDEVIARFMSLVLQEKLCVLYGKSGYGKSSLLNAGVQPALEAENAKGKRRYVSVPLRFLAASGQAEDNLYEQFTFHLGRAMQAAGVAPADTDTALPSTLWGAFKRWRTDTNTVFVLLFDQFEELFSYAPEQQQAFRQQLAELLYTDYPQFLEDNEETLPSAESRRLAEKTQVHAVLAIRADRMSELDRLKDQLPAILHKRFELRALPREEAERALTEPAALAGRFVSKPFAFDTGALQGILDFLKDAEGQIDPIQLQILAESFEQRRMSEGIDTFRADNIGDLKGIIARYYSDKIAALHESAQRLAVRRLCEEGLAQEGDPPLRLSLHAAQIRQFYGIEQALLDELVNMRLLRAEAGRGGGATYELPHDTLLGAVLEARQQRWAEEKKEREARELAEESARIAQEKADAERRRKRALVTAAVAGVLILLAVVSLIFAGLKSRQAQADQQKAQVAQELAEKKTQEAEASETKATAAQQEAKLKADIAELKEIEAKTATELAELKKKEAALAALQAVVSIVEQARRDILMLDYDAALTKLKTAASLETLQDSVAFELMEIAWFRHYSGQAARVREPYDMAARLLGKARLQGQPDFARLDAGRTLFLKKRYLGEDMVALEGGSFRMQGQKYGGDVPEYEAQVADFKLARYETTVWQYNLFGTAMGRNITQRISTDGKTVEEYKYQPAWGWIGNHPVVYVSWYDAVAYANWLSTSTGRRPAYDIPFEPDSLNTSMSDGFQWTIIPRPGADGFRLPTEIEWEFAARGGLRRDTFIYSGSDDLELVGWYSDNSDSHTHAVGGKNPNGAGLYDLSGNVWEWCFDWYGALPADSPLGARSGINRVLRGGSWLDGYDFCFVALRDGNSPNVRSYGFGFRLARH